jgi:hypothetical protein
MSELASGHTASRAGAATPGRRSDEERGATKEGVTFGRPEASGAHSE